jgi:hypothetical protein
MSEREVAKAKNLVIGKIIGKVMMVLGRSGRVRAQDLRLSNFAEAMSTSGVKTLNTQSNGLMRRIEKSGALFCPVNLNQSMRYW